MKRFKNILLVIEDTEQAQNALLIALDLAERNKARLDIISVVEEKGLRWGSSNGSDRSVEDWMIEENRSQLQTFVDLVAGERFEGTLSVVSGTAFLEIIRHVIRHEVDLVIKPASGVTGPVRSMLFGSTALHLIRKCPCPVWVVKDQPYPGISKVLVAVSAEEEDNEERLQLDQALVEMGSSLAEGYSGEWDIVHAWRLAGESMLASRRTPMNPEEIQGLLDEVKVGASDRVQSLVDSANVEYLAAKVHLIKGLPAIVIPEIAQSLRCDVVVMGSVGRTGIPGLFMSDTAEIVLTQLDCSVLAVKPAGFKSPVKL